MFQFCRIINYVSFHFSSLEIKFRTRLPDWELLARLRDVDWSFFAEDDDDFGGDVGTTRSCCFRHWLKKLLKKCQIDEQNQFFTQN